MTTPKVKLDISKSEWNDLMNTTFGAPVSAAKNTTAQQIVDHIERARRNPQYDPWNGPLGYDPGYDPAQMDRLRKERYEQERLEGMVGDMVRRRVRAELDRMNSTRTAMVQLEVCAEGGFTVVHNGSKYACADTQALTERIVAITAVMALEQMDKEKS